MRPWRGGRLQAELVHGGTALLLVAPVVFPPTGTNEGAVVAVVDYRKVVASSAPLVAPGSCLLLRMGALEIPIPAGCHATSDAPTIARQLDLPQSLKPLNAHIRGFSAPETGSVATRNLIVGYALVVGTLMLVAVLLSRRLSRRIVEPLARLTDTADRIVNDTRLDLRAPVISHDETGRLAGAFNRMLESLQAVQAKLIEDIARRQRAEEALRSREERLRLALVAGNLGFYDLDLRTGVAVVSPEYARMLGYEVDELDTNAAAWLERTHEDDRELAEHTLRECIEGRRPDYRLEYRHRARSGAWLWIQSVGKVVGWGEQGRPSRMLGTHADITARKLAEQAVRDSESQLKHAQQLAHVGSWRLDLSSNDLQWSDETYRVFGVPIGRPTTPEGFFSLLHPADKERVAQAWEATMAGAPYDIEHRILSAGVERWVRETAQVERDARGHPTVAHGAVQDITERKASESALRASEQRFRRMIECSPMPIGLSDRNGRIEYVNPRFTELMGYTLADIPTVEVWFAEAYPDPDYRQQVVQRWSRAMLNVDRDGAAGDLIGVSLRTKQGSEVIMDLFGASMGDTLMVMFSNQTERRRAEEALKRLNATLEARVKEELARNREKDHLMIQQSRLAAMGEMIGNIAHQWRQPINVLALLLGNLKDARDFGELTPEYLEAQVERGQLMIQKMSTTIDDFRNFFRPNREPLPFQLSAAVKDALSIIESAFASHSIGIDVTVERDATVLGFPNEYTQVLLNLLTNAREAIEARSVRPGRVHIVVDSNGAEARLVMRDNGGGIARDVLPKIFDPYFTTRGSGTGIGLYMSKMIIETNMHGRIEVDNTADGAQFTIIAPIAPADSRAVSAEAAAGG